MLKIFLGKGEVFKKEMIIDKGDGWNLMVEACDNREEDPRRGSEAAGGEGAEGGGEETGLFEALAA